MDFLTFFALTALTFLLATFFAIFPLIVLECFCICRSKWCFVTKAHSHLLHLKFFSFVCLLLMWNFNACDSRNVWSQSNGHLCGFSPVCSRWCLFRSLDRAKDFSQYWQPNGLSPVCTRSWACLSGNWLNRLSQCTHLNGRSLVCSRLCTSQWSLRRNALPQTLHTNCFSAKWTFLMCDCRFTLW